MDSSLSRPTFQILKNIEVDYEKLKIEIQGIKAATDAKNAATDALNAKTGAKNAEIGTNRNNILYLITYTLIFSCLVHVICWCYCYKRIVKKTRFNYINNY